MSTLCIVPCGRKKIWDKFPNHGPTEAKFVYIGPFASKCKEYAEMFFPSSWCILSAKYGFLLPDGIVPKSYNVSFNDKSGDVISLEKLSDQLPRKGLDVYDRIIVLGGRNYTEIMRQVFPTKGISNPLSGSKNIMQMIGKLNKAIKNKIPFQYRFEKNHNKVKNRRTVK